MTDPKWNFIDPEEGKVITKERLDTNTSLSRTQEDDSAAVVLLELALFPTKIIVRDANPDASKKDESKGKEVRLANACDFHKRKHQKCPKDCNHRQKKKSRKRKQETASSTESEEDKSTKPLQQT